VYCAETYLESHGRTQQKTVKLDGTAELPEMDRLQLEEGLPLHPGAFALGSTIERLQIPNNLAARVEGRSSFGRLGLMVHATAGFIDPGFEGQITLEFVNVSPNVIVLTPLVRICQISFYRLLVDASHPYGDFRHKSKYQNQDGPVASRINIELRGKDDA
jgi:dCTP deaminase